MLTSHLAPGVPIEIDTGQLKALHGQKFLLGAFLMHRNNVIHNLIFHTAGSSS